MSGTIASVEDAIIAQGKAQLQGKVRTVDTLPGAWSIETLRRILQQAPAVFVVFAGGQAGRNDDETTIDARFVVYCVSGQASGHAARRRGSAQEIGAYEMLETLVPALHGYTVTDRGTLQLQQVGQEINEATFELGAAVYSASFALPKLQWSLDEAPNIADFITYHQDYDLDPDSDAEPLQEDTVTLPQ